MTIWRLSVFCFLSVLMISCAGEDSVNPPVETPDEYKELQALDSDYFSQLGFEKYKQWKALVTDLSFSDAKGLGNCDSFSLGKTLEAGDIPRFLPKLMPTDHLNQLEAKGDLKNKKRIFACYMLPNIIVSNWKIVSERKKFLLSLEDLSAAGSTEYLDALLSSYGEKWNNKLSKDQVYKMMSPRLLPVPISLALAQASIESGWGIQSRFAYNCNNYYGLHYYGKSVVPEKCMTKNKKVKLMFFDSLLESTEAYMIRFNSGINTYKNFRASRHKLYKKAQFGGAILSDTFPEYAPLNKKYAIQINSSIKQNNYYKFDALIDFDSLSLLDGMEANLY